MERLPADSPKHLRLCACRAAIGDWSVPRQLVLVALPQNERGVRNVHTRNKILQNVRANTEQSQTLLTLSALNEPPERALT